MALARNRRLEPVNYWPGFVDALSTMLLIIIFLLSVFMLSQYFLTREVSGKDSALDLLNRQIEELTTLLAMERSQSGADADKITQLSATLDQARAIVAAPAEHLDPAAIRWLAPLPALARFSPQRQPAAAAAVPLVRARLPVLARPSLQREPAAAAAVPLACTSASGPPSSLGSQQQHQLCRWLSPRLPALA